MPEYRLLFAELQTGDLLGELTTFNVTATTTLNAAGSLSATVALDDPSGAVNSATLAVANTAVYLERSGTILWGGILWTARADVAAGTLQLGCAGFHSYFEKRTMRSILDTTDDQLAIAKFLLDYAQSFTGGDVDVQTVTETSGVSRHRRFEAYERKPIAEAIEQLAAVENGFDFAYVTDRSGPSGAIATTWHAYYPDEGRTTEHVFALGVNCALLEYSEDGTTMANVVDAIGSGEGDDKLIATAVNVTTLGPYPMLEDVVSFTDVSDADTLNTHARRRLARGAGPMRNVTLTAYPDTVPTIGSYLVGDQVRVVASAGWVNVDDTFRIVEQKLDLADGAETVTITLAGLEAFQAV